MSANTMVKGVVIRGILRDTKENLPGGGRAEVIEDLGSRTAQRDLNSILKIYAALSSTYRVGQHSTMVWSQRFKNAGVMTMADKKDRSFRLNLENFSDIHRHHCSFLAGYGRQMGLTWEKTFKVIHDQCVHRGAGSCSWLGTW